MNRGKIFEKRFALGWNNTFKGEAVLIRLPDQMSGYKMTSKNICDFVGYSSPLLFLIECKSREKNTFPIDSLTQYDALKEEVGKKGVRVGVVIWFVDHDKIVYVPVKEITRMIQDGKKSINIKMLNDKSYDIIEIPSVKKRVYLESDYSCLLNLPEGY